MPEMTTEQLVEFLENIKKMYGDFITEIILIPAAKDDLFNWYISVSFQF